ncbi:TetR/AcrR family transcriptional regulator [Saccharothrix mutabilis subsp. mutabilis]|uniref:TetR/AcrR family transcriptional regulator n=1 Tax=Saccharothrix mutabilis subsp. mutabilis TaxID=66855 RepID=A0ABN0T069_9PSEU
MERKTRRRGADLEEAILDAAAAELTEHGYAALTMDKVAKRAGTNKNALYRRWPNRAALAIAAYKHLVSAETPVPDTGELRGDALELLRRANSYWSSPQGAVLRDLMGSIGLPELLAQARDEVADAGSAWWLTVVQRAVARGEARPEALRPRVATVPIALLRNEFLTSGTPTVPDRVLVEIVDEVYLPLVRDR